MVTNENVTFSARFRTITSCVMLIHSFGFGVLVSSAGDWGKYGIGVGGALVFGGSLYGLMVAFYLWQRSSGRRAA
jgi:hypothetical protein